jgi:uncharacterized repeat protein (TIGR01451 family)
MSRFRFLGRLGAVLLGLGGGVSSAQVAPSRIVNTATLAFGPDAARRVVSSNRVSLDVARAKRPTSFSFRLLPTDYTLSGLRCQTTPTIEFTPASIDAATLARASALDTIDIHTPLIIVIDNQGDNRDPLARESVMIDVDTGTAMTNLKLLETAPDSGVFAGGVPATGQGPAEVAACDLNLKRGMRLKLSFVENEYSLSSSTELLIDPAGFVFDSKTAELIDGAIVSLVDDTGAPAQVFGDDGTSAYPSTVMTGKTVTDASGRVYPGLPGRYRFPLTFPGRYTLKVTPPGAYTAPSSVPRETLATLKDANGDRFMLNEASFGGLFALADADPFYADIPVDKATDAAMLLLTKTASVRQASPGDFVQYRIQVRNRGTGTARGLHLSDTLPNGLRYERGSTRGADEPAIAGDARTLDFAVPPLAAGQSLDLRYVVTVAPGAPTGEALNRAVMHGTGVDSNEAAASVRIQPLLFTDAMTIIGRVTEGNCGDPVDHRKGVSGVRLLMEDGTFVVTDRDGLYHFEGVRSGRHVVQLDKASIPPTHEPVACDSDTRQAGSAISRFVEGGGGLLKRVDFQLRPTGVSAAAAQALPVVAVDDATAAGNRDWLASHPTPGIDWLFPSAGHNPRSPTQRVVIKHGADQRIALSINGRQVDAMSFDGTDGDVTTGVALSKWTGLPLVEGDNRLQARILAADGSVVQTLDRTVHFAGPGIRAVVDVAHSRLVADGLTRPLLAVRVTDKDGRPVRAGTQVPFTVDQPYTAATEIEREQTRQLTGDRTGIAAQVVGDDGIAFLALQPTTQAGAVRAVVALAEEKTTRTSEIRGWLAGAQKDWVVVGFGAGSLDYDMLRRRQSGLPSAERNTVVTDGQLAFYAKGRIKGSWLATIAYGSDRKYDPDRGLLGTIDPDRYYTVYGDGSRQGYDAATRRKLYLRLERREVYALFGDFETGFTDSQLLRYNRTLNGVKAAYEGKHVRATGFAAHTDTLYSRDEIQGNGLSGPYRLGGRNIVPNSDKLRIEVRDRFRSELIVSTTQLTRHIDYDIDTQMGTLRFREPVLSRDSALNPIFIVADYEVEGGRSAKLAAAARVATKLLEDRVEIGASVIRDETAGNATVAGIDLKLRADKNTELRGELGRGGRGGIGKGTAYIAEVDHHGSKLDLLAYARQQDGAFGVGQQNLVEAGTRKFGFDGRLRLTDRLGITSTAWHQTQLDSPATRLAGDVRVEYKRDTGTVFIGGQFASDRGIDGEKRDSRLLTIGGSQSLFGDKLVLGGQTQFAPGGDSDSVDFPIRHQITASYRIKPGIRLIGGYEISNGDDYVAHTKRIGVDVAPWTGAKVMSMVNQQAASDGGGENGQRTYAQYGLSQSVPLGKRWTVDATLDSSRTLKGEIPAGAVINAFQPIASGGSLGGGGEQINGDYTAATFGGNYRADRWTWNGRLEYRAADAADRWGITTNFLRTLGEGKTLASSLHAYTIKDKTGAVATYANADLAIAWRPLDSRWSLLERLELRHERADVGFTDDNTLGVPTYGAGDQVTSRIVNNLALNYRTGAEGAGHGLEATIYYGAKYVAGRFADDTYDGYIDVTGFELRKDVGSRLDIGVQGSVQHGWSRGVVSFSGGPSAGVSPAPNVWVSAGYNIAGYRDRDFEDDRYTRQGPYVTMRLKFDQSTLGGATRALFGGRR